MNSVDVLNALSACNELIEVKMPFGAAMALRKLVRELSSLAEDVEAERQKLLKQYAELDDDGQIVVKDGNAVIKDQTGFEQAYQDLLTTEVQVEHKIQAPMFDNIEVEPRLLVLLGDTLDD